MANNALAEPRSPRRHDLDWIRVVAIGSLLVYHSALVFAGRGWVIANPDSSTAIAELCFFFAQWRMPLMFLVSGVAASAALERRTSGRFFADRARRLGVPLLFGILLVVPPQLYVRLHGTTGESFAEFYPHFLDAMLAGDRVNWEHLWYIVYLIVADFLAYPLVQWVRGEAGKAARDRFAQRIAHGGGLFLPVVPLVLIAALRDRWVEGWTFFGVIDFKFFASMFTFYTIGLLATSSGPVWPAVERRRREMLAAAVAALVVLYALRWGFVVAPHAARLLARGATVWAAVNSWCWVAAFLGYAARYLRFEHPVLRYTREASYPVYLLHQAVIVVVALYVVTWHASIAAKLAVVVVVSTAVVLLAYELVIRRIAVTRFLFGLKPLAAGGSGARAERGRGPTLPAPVAIPAAVRASGVIPGAPGPYDGIRVDKPAVATTPPSGHRY